MQHANRQRRRRRERFGSASAATRRRRRQQATLERSTADSTTESLAVLYIRCLWYERCLLVAEELPSGDFRRDKRPNKTLLVCHRSKDAPRYNSKDICCSAYSHFSIYICICRIYINVVLRRACAYSRA